jgi:hypothetical protein
VKTAVGEGGQIGGYTAEYFHLILLSGDDRIDFGFRRPTLLESLEAREGFGNRSLTQRKPGCVWPTKGFRSVTSSRENLESFMGETAAMVMITFVLIAVLLLGFVLGRIWEIRHQIVLAEAPGTRQRPIEAGVAGVLAQALSDDRGVLAALQQISNVVTATAPAQEQPPKITIRRLGSTPELRRG